MAGDISHSHYYKAEIADHGWRPLLYHYKLEMIDPGRRHIVQQDKREMTDHGWRSLVHHCKREMTVHGWRSLFLYYKGDYKGGDDWPWLKIDLSFTWIRGIRESVNP